jgi:hypothetical protein
MQKISLSFAILTSVLVIIFLMQPITQVTVVKANFYPYGLPKINVRSPHSSSYIYVKPNVDISFDYHVPNTQVNSFSYSLDENANSTLSILKTANIYYYNAVNYTVFKTLENLANGHHKIIVYAHFFNNTASIILSSTINVDTAFIPPLPFMISPLNQTTYNTKQVPLTYTINSKILWSYYSIDATDYIPNFKGFSGNITLPSLSEGTHKLKLVVTTEDRETTIYSDTVQTIYFSIDSSQIIQATPVPSQSTPTPTMTPTSTPTLPEFSLLVVLPLFLLVLLIVVLFRKTKVGDSHD